VLREMVTLEDATNRARWLNHISPLPPSPPPSSTYRLARDRVLGCHHHAIRPVPQPTGDFITGVNHELGAL